MGRARCPVPQVPSIAVASSPWALRGGHGVWGDMGQHMCLDHDERKWLGHNKDQEAKTIVTKKDSERRARYARDGSAVEDFPLPRQNEQQTRWTHQKTVFDVPNFAVERMTTEQQRWDRQECKAISAIPRPSGKRTSSAEKRWMDGQKTCYAGHVNIAPDRGSNPTQSKVIESAPSEQEYHSYRLHTSKAESRWSASGKTIANEPRRGCRRRA